MRKFNVTVNGVVYEVEVEEVSSEGAAAPVAAPAAAPKAAPVAAPAPKAPAKTGKAGATAIKAPMPGSILKINVGVGSSVKKGDVICVLEAMKMENDICAPCDGVIASIDVAKGASVATDALIATID